jgi:hypothetical protein
MIAAGAVVLVASGAVGISAASAAPPEPKIRPHQHYAVTADGDKVRVGPNACRDGMSIAFDKFHLNGHVGVPGSMGKIVRGDC